MMDCLSDRLPVDINLDAIWHSSDIAKEWDRTAFALDALTIPDGTGGVNPGDRRAMFYLMRHLKPRSVLEVGTHIGASTVYIAAALEPGARMTTVDIVDVNATNIANWRCYGMTNSPLNLLNAIGLSDPVTFVIGRSTDYLQSNNGQLDFVFLDGDHSQKVVHAEIPLALKRLTQGGIILLHDFFPHNKPLWPGHEPICGPWLAVEQLRAEGCRVRALPLGELPWPTTLGSRITNLALLLRD